MTSRTFSPPVLDEVVDDIKRVLEEAELSPDELTISKYNELGGMFDGRRLRRIGGFAAIMNNAFRSDMGKDIVTSRYLNQSNHYIKSLENQVADKVIGEKTFLQRFDECAKEVLKNKVVIKPYQSKSKSDAPRVVNVMLSDLHFHSLLNPAEVPLQYGPLEEARRLAAVMVQAAEYKKQYRSDTELNVHLLGDIIQGQLHDARDGATLAEQACASIFLLTQAIAFLRSEYKKVTVRCTTGNHGRNGMRHHERAVNQKFDSIETIVYYGIKNGLAHLPNVTVEIPRTPYYTYSAFNRSAFMTHGDTVLSPGYPGKSIDVSNIRKQINEINAKLTHDDKYTLFAVGHVHIGSITHLPNGAIFMSNGALIPTDAYGISMGNFDTACGQWIWESVEDYIVGDHRFAVVNEHTDKDVSLDKIIKPFRSF